MQVSTEKHKVSCVCARACVCAGSVCAWVADMQNTFRQVDTLCHGPQHVESAKYVTIKEDQGTSMHKVASACLQQVKVTRPPVDWCSYVRSVHFLCVCLVCVCVSERTRNVHTYTHVHTHTRTYTQTYIHTHTHTYTHEPHLHRSSPLRFSRN